MALSTETIYSTLYEYANSEIEGLEKTLKKWNAVHPDRCNYGGIMPGRKDKNNEQQYYSRHSTKAGSGTQGE